MKIKYTKEILQEAVDNSTTVMEVLDFLGIKRAGGSHYHIKKRIDLYDIDTSHFLGKSFNKGKPSKNRRKHTKESFVEKVLCENGLGWKSSGIREKLLEFSLKENVCEICGQLPEWNGKPLTLHLDHINGNHEDNRLENLRILCPHCHSQTDTFCANKKAR